MIIDWHAHVYSPEMADERRWGGESPLTIENLLAAHEAAGSISVSSATLLIISGTRRLRNHSPLFGAGINMAPRSSRSTIKNSGLHQHAVPCGGDLRLPHGRGQAVALRQRRAAAVAPASPGEKDHRRASDTGQ